MEELQEAQAEIRRLRSVVRELKAENEAAESRNEKLSEVYGNLLRMIEESARNIINGHPVGYDFRVFVENKFGLERVSEEWIKEVMKCSNCGKQECDCFEVISQCAFCPLNESECAKCKNHVN